MENYCKTIHIEALTMIDIVNEEIIPACVSYQNELAKLLQRKNSNFDCTMEEKVLSRVSRLCCRLMEKLEALEAAISASAKDRDILPRANFYRDEVFPAMKDLRLAVDELESRLAKKHWPLPSYGEMLYSVN
jgi:glutamine synthetase